MPDGPPEILLRVIASRQHPVLIPAAWNVSVTSGFPESPCLRVWASTVSAVAGGAASPGRNWGVFLSAPLARLCVVTIAFAIAVLPASHAGAARVPEPTARPGALLTPDLATTRVAAERANRAMIRRP